MSNKMNNYSHVIWDWNGTLLNDVDLCYSIINEMLNKRSINELYDINAYKDIFDFPIINYYKKAGFDFNKEKFEELAAEYILLYHDRDKMSCSLHSGAADTIKAISKKGINQIILSASKKSNLIMQIEHYDIKDYFNDILGITDIYAGSKIDIGMDYVSKTIIKKAVLIGDTVHDYETAEALGVECILIANGHQKRERLLSCNVKVLNNINEVLNLML